MGTAVPESHAPPLPDPPLGIGPPSLKPCADPVPSMTTTWPSVPATLGAFAASAACSPVTSVTMWVWTPHASAM